jgi:hypothetical protein
MDELEAECLYQFVEALKGVMKDYDGAISDENLLKAALFFGVDEIWQCGLTLEETQELVADFWAVFDENEMRA